jgi:hypothetical protein
VYRFPLHDFLILSTIFFPFAFFPFASSILFPAPPFHLSLTLKTAPSRATASCTAEKYGF